MTTTLLASLEEQARELEASGNYIVVRRFTPKTAYHTDPPAKVCRGVILDTETTGRDVKVDKVIELGMVLFEYCPETGRVFGILKTFNQLEDPGMPIEEGASKVNGITDEMVKGKKIDDAEVEAFLENVEIVIAHNAQFDRQILEKRLPIFMHLPWGCSRMQVDWDAEGFGTHKLDYIAYRLGFFYEAHRADADCYALLDVLQHKLPESQGYALKQIIDLCPKEDFRIWALDAKFEKKDVLKERGYRWGDGTEGREKAWYIEVPEELYEAEIAWLKEQVYFNRNFRVAVDIVGAFNRFSNRSGTRNTVFCT